MNYVKKRNGILIGMNSIKKLFTKYESKKYSRFNKKLYKVRKIKCLILERK